MKWKVKLVAEAGHGEALEREIASIEREFRTKGYYQSTLRSVYGKVQMRVRRIRGCSCSGSQGRTYSTLFTNKSPITPELRYLTAKMAALLPFGRAADFLGELLPLPAVRGCLRSVGIGFGRLRMMPNSPYATDLTNSAWELVAPLLPGALPGGRPRTTDVRAVLNAIFYLLRTGCQWRLLPREFPVWGTVYHYFRSWKNAGVWTCLQKAIYEHVRTEAGRASCPSVVIMDSQSVVTDILSPWLLKG